MTKTEVRALLSRSERAVEAALLGLLARQTVGEQVTGHTSEANGRGFNRDDAPFGTSLAMWVKSGKCLTPRQLKAAVPLCTWYWRQVGQMAEVRRFLPRPPIKVTVIQGDDLSYMLRQFDKFQQFA
jgi:hypothetical protein